MEIMKSAPDWDRGKQPWHGLDQPSDDWGAGQAACPAAETTGLRDSLEKREESRPQESVFLIEVS